MTKRPPLISIVGYSGSGKTTLIEKLIPALKARGYRIGVIKHALHGFEIDRKGKDSFRHRKAGADAVMVASPGVAALVRDIDEDSPEHLLPYFDGMDLVLTEGFKKGRRPKIEVFRSGVHSQPACLTDPELIALATDAPQDLKVPCFGLEDIRSLASFIARKRPLVRIPHTDDSIRG